MIRKNQRYKLISADEKNLNSLYYYEKANKRKRRKSLRIIFFLCVNFIILFIFFVLKKMKKIKIKTNMLFNSFQNKNFSSNSQNTIDIDIYNKTVLKQNRSVYTELDDCQKFVNIAVNHSLINPNEVIYKSENPKISVVIPMYNAEGYIENAICAIENQDFKDIEIIIIDDNSKDNSVHIVKQLMQRDPRIILYQNEETKGTLYSKAKGVSLCKAKYVLVSDQDDLYTQEDAFSSMYYELEKNNLDILGFASIFVKTINLKDRPSLYIFQNTPIYHQPQISYRMYYRTGNNTVKRLGDVIWNYIFKTEVFTKSIIQIDDKILNTRMNCHEDFLLFFLLTRNANSIKNIKRIFYAHIYWVNSTKSSILFSKNEKEIVKKNYKCLSYINYIEFLLTNTYNNINDKQIASYELRNWFLNHQCKNNTFIEERAKNVCKLFLENSYIEDDVKKEIRLFLNETGK